MYQNHTTRMREGTTSTRACQDNQKRRNKFGQSKTGVTSISHSPSWSLPLTRTPGDPSLTAVASEPGDLATNAALNAPSLSVLDGEEEGVLLVIPKEEGVGNSSAGGTHVPNLLVWVRCAEEGVVLVLAKGKAAANSSLGIHTPNPLLWVWRAHARSVPSPSVLG